MNTFWWLFVFLWCGQYNVVAVNQDYKLSATVTRFTPSANATVDVQLSWHTFYNSQIYEYPTILTQLQSVDSYEAQYMVEGIGEWNTLSTTITGTNALYGHQHDKAPMQSIMTQVDDGKSISGGFFRLMLLYGGRNPAAVGTTNVKLITPPISFDATESEMKHAIESLDVIYSVQVFRRPRFTGVNDGTFEWTIIFDSYLDTNDPLPLLQLYTETLSFLPSGFWSGPASQISIRFIRPQYETLKNHTVLCHSICTYYIKNLPTGRPLIFRVRARLNHNNGVSSFSFWSPASNPLITPRAVVPGRPPTPKLLATTSRRLTIHWNPPFVLDGMEDIYTTPILHYHVQSQCQGVSNQLWRDVASPTRDIFGQPLLIAQVDGLAPNISCSFRVAAVNTIGKGPFSTPSIPYFTIAEPPSQPQNLRVTKRTSKSYSNLLWDAPALSGGSQITSYVLQYKQYQSPTWTQLTEYSCKSLPCDSTISYDLEHVEQHLLSYTRYLVRVQAISMAGLGKFSKTADFLTSFKVRHQDSLPISLLAKGFHSLQAGVGREPGGKTCPYYRNGIAKGGANGLDGGNGLIVVVPITRSASNQISRGSAQFYYSSPPTIISIPYTFAASEIISLEFYVWGGGGGSGEKTKSEDTNFSFGGGGAFVRGKYNVHYNDTVVLVVGRGGKGSIHASKSSSYNYDEVFAMRSGGLGGKGDYAGGSGGDASIVKINKNELIIAAGGGGGGATDYCCAHGGAGGGDDKAQNGLAPDANSIPLPIEQTSGDRRDEYHSHFMEGDDRDFKGLPARHLHLDYGYAGSTANFSTLATGGTGAFGTKFPGTGGGSGSYDILNAGKLYGLYDIISPISKFSATNGMIGKGGSGQDGKEGGGGGGGGYYGGGGGGSGIDGAGGGGGSSYISLSSTHPSFSSMQRNIDIDQYSTSLQVSPFSVSTVLASWNIPEKGFQKPVEYFALEMANGTINDDWKVLRTLPPKTYSTQLSGLRPGKVYQFRLRVIFISSNQNEYVTPIQTVNMPNLKENTWSFIHARPFSEKFTAAGYRGGPYNPTRESAYPPALRGHTLTALENYIYIFGGMKYKAPCLEEKPPKCIISSWGKESCSNKSPSNCSEMSNDLWRFDPLTSMWINLQQAGDVPSAREKHSIAVISNHLVLFGGQTAKSDPISNNIWDLSVTSTTKRHTKRWTTIQDLTSELTDGETIYSNINAAEDGLDQNYCVQRVVISIYIKHPAPQTLHIQFYGPGPSNFPEKLQSETFPLDTQVVEQKWSNENGYYNGSARFTSKIPSNREHSVTLQIPKIHSQEYKSEEEDGKVHLLQYTSHPSKEITTVPALLTFQDLYAYGEWQLSISDPLPDGKEGRLEKWDLELQISPCIPKFEWRRIISTSKESPSPRFQHRAIALNDSMYIFGGISIVNRQILYDAYRLDYDIMSMTGEWIKLPSLESSKQRKFLSQGLISLLTPFDMLYISNNPSASYRMHGNVPKYLQVKTRRLTDPIAKSQLIKVTAENSISLPDRRVWTAATIISNTDSDHFSMFMYGGQDEIGAMLLDDLWRLDIFIGENSIDSSTTIAKLKQDKIAFCEWKRRNAAIQSTWQSSCGMKSISLAATPKECSLETLQLAVWCQDYFANE